MSLILSPTDDTYYGTAFSAGPNGTATTLGIGGWGDNYYTFIQFDITSGPTAANTSSAIMRLYQVGTPTNNCLPQVYRITSSWDEDTLTRTVNPTWTTDQSYRFIPDYTNADGYKYVDLTDVYKQWKNGTYSNYGVTIRGTFTTDAAASFASNNNATEAYRPILTITSKSSVTGISTLKGIQSITI